MCYIIPTNWQWVIQEKGGIVKKGHCWCCKYRPSSHAASFCFTSKVLVKLERSLFRTLGLLHQSLDKSSSDTCSVAFPLYVNTFYCWLRQASIERNSFPAVKLHNGYVDANSRGTIDPALSHKRMHQIWVTKSLMAGEGAERARVGARYKSAQPH